MVEPTDKVVTGLMKRAVTLGFSGFTEVSVKSMLGTMNDRDLRLVSGRFEECKSVETLSREFGISKSRTYRLIDIVVYKAVITGDGTVEMFLFLKDCLTGSYVRRVFNTFKRCGICKVSDLLEYDELSSISGLSAVNVEYICAKAKEYLKDKQE